MVRFSGSTAVGAMRLMLVAALGVASTLPGLVQGKEPSEKPRQKSKLFVTLPEYCPTPDGMAIAPDGRLVVACPNYADQSKCACLIKIDRRGNVQKWVDVPKLDVTGVACPMGICFGDDGDLYVVDNQGWTGSEKGKFQGRVLRLKIRDDAVVRTTVLARGMEHPNGIRHRDGQLYVTQSMMSKVKDPSGLLVSGLYRFNADDATVSVENRLDDENLILSVLTTNRDCQYGLDGLDFDSEGNLYVGNFGDGAILKIRFDADGKPASSRVWAKNLGQMRTTDGICFDSEGNLYVADFSDNAVALVTPDAQVRRIAKSLDCDGSRGGLDQPGEPIVFDGRLIVTCFDMVTGPDKVNTRHDKPYTIAVLDLE